MRPDSCWSTQDSGGAAWWGRITAVGESPGVDAGAGTGAPAGAWAVGGGGLDPVEKLVRFWMHREGTTNRMSRQIQWGSRERGKPGASGGVWPELWERCRQGRAGR